MDSEHTEFPSDETLAAFIDGRLDTPTRDRVLEHMTGCEECYSTWLAATDAKRELSLADDMPASLGAAHDSTASTEKVAPLVRRRSFAGAAIFAAAAAIVAAFLLPQLRDRLPFMSHTSIAALAEASGPYRSGEARVSALPYRPVGTLRGGGDSDDSENWKLLAIAARARKAAKARPTAENLHTLAVAELMRGDSVRASDVLESVIRASDPNEPAAMALQRVGDSSLLCDFAAAMYGRWQSGQRTSDLEIAYAAAIAKKLGGLSR
ncbi:MAG: zf-HC2 domain-containing protein, partial [Acidobacteriota bacterium]